MAPGWELGGGLLHGPLLPPTAPLALTVGARVCDLRPRLLAKGWGGRGYRAVARNGRVLLASPLPLEELIGREFRLRFQVWHRAILPGDPPEPYGVLVCVDRRLPAVAEPLLDTCLVSHREGTFDLALELGGGTTWEFRRHPTVASGPAAGQDSKPDRQTLGLES